MIRILYVNGGLMNRGGIESYMMNYYRHLDRSKIQIDFIVHDAGGYGYYDEERWVKCAGVYKTNSLTLGIKFQLFIHKIKIHFEDIKEKIYYFFLFQKWKRLFGK